LAAPQVSVTASLEPKRKEVVMKVSVLLPWRMLKQIDRMARQNRMSRSSCIRMLLERVVCTQVDGQLSFWEGTD
jgi:hypothetical protein